MFTFIKIAQYLNSVSTNILLLDEILDSNSLDESGVMSLIKETKKITQKENKRVLVISHNESAINYFNQNMIVEFDGAFANISKK
jgi:ABC-type dipeptide/oligopeptide/nickel transport system ATPase subunit